MEAIVQGNNLLKNIPGLSAHQVEVPVVVSSFNHIKADRLRYEALGDIGPYFSGVAFNWLRENRPDVHRYLWECFCEIETAVLGENWKRFIDALEKWVAAHKRAGAVFESRPPYIDMDPELF